MIFLNLVFKNLFRNKRKFLLTLLGVGLAFSILIGPLLMCESAKVLVEHDYIPAGDFIIERQGNLSESSFDLMSMVVELNGPSKYNQTYLDNHFSSFKNVSE